MKKSEIKDKITLKQNEVRLERNPNKKQELQRELEILNLRLDIKRVQERIKELLNV